MGVRVGAGQRGHKGYRRALVPRRRLPLCAVLGAVAAPLVSVCYVRYLSQLTNPFAITLTDFASLGAHLARA